MKNTRNTKIKDTHDFPQIFTVWSDEVVSGGRLDAKYWIPAIRELQKAIRSGKYKSQKLGDFIIDIHYGVSTTNEYVDDGIRLLRILNLKDEGLDLSDIVYLPEKARATIGKAFVHQGDMLISRSGSVGIVVVVPKEADGFAFGSFMIRFVLNDKINKQYIAAWLNSEASRKLIEREKIGAIQGNITIETIKNFDIPVPPLSIQKEVVERIQAAYEQKRKKEGEVKAILASIDDFVLGELGIVIERERERVDERAPETYVVWSDAIEKRLDPMYFHPARLRAIEAIKKSGQKIASLAEVAEFHREIVGEIPEGAPYLGLENIASNSGEYVENGEKESVSSAFIFKQGDVLFPKLRPYLNKVFYADFDGVCSTEFHVLRAQKCKPFYLFAFLSRSVVVEQTSRLMTGNTLPRLQTEEIENLLVPIPSTTKQEKITIGVKSSYLKMRTLRVQAAEVLAGAQKQVEHMIGVSRI